MRVYILKLKHDGGYYTIQTAATSEEKAISNVMACEGCPRSAIVSVRFIAPGELADKSHTYIRKPANQ